jgi:gliding motility-associated-like protein
MIRLLHDTVRLGLAIMLPMLLVLAPAKAETVVYTGTTTTLEVVQVPGDTYVWDLYNDSTVNFATVSGACPVTSAAFTGGNTGPKVNVAWLQEGVYFFKVTARNASGCTNNLKIGKVKVVPLNVEAVISGTTLIGVCQQIKLDASKSTGDIIKYEWSVLDPGGVLTRQTGIDTEFLISPSYSGQLPADFRVRLLVTDRTGQTDSYTISVRVDPLPIAGITSSLQPDKDGSMRVDGSISLGTGLSYKWSTTEGKIVGPTDKPAANLLGAGMYTLEVADIHGCKSVKTFRFPIELYQITARPDYARTSWAEDTTVIVLANDQSTAGLVPGTVRVIKPPARGETRVNADGTITYIPTGRVSGNDEFTYEVHDIVGLSDSALVSITIYDAGVKVPEGLSPNGDGMNDIFEIKGLESYPNSTLVVFTRSGQIVFESNDYQNDWDGRSLVKGTSNYKLLPTGVYYYILELGGVNHTIKGFIYISY